MALMGRRRRMHESMDRLYAACNAHDAETVSGVYAEDVVLLDVVSGTVTNGRDAIRQISLNQFCGFPDFSVERVALLIDDNVAAHRWVMRGTNTGGYDGIAATGKPIEVSGATFSEYDDLGFIATSTIYVDVPAFLRQLGLA